MENLNTLKSTLHGKNYTEKYEIWMKILDVMEGQAFHLKCELYSEFLQEYPFVYDQWNLLAQMYAKEKENAKAFQIYEWGLGLNKRCLKLWQCFCSWVEDTYRDNKQLIRESYKKAVTAVGLDFNSGLIWDRYLRFEETENNIENQNTLYWTLVSVPQKNISSLASRFKNFIERLDDLEILKSFAEKLNVQINLQTPESTQSAETTQLQISTYKKSLMNLYDAYIAQTFHFASNKSVFEEKLKQTAFEGKTHELADKNSWLNYINYEKSVSANQPTTILFVIEKATTYLCTCPEIWRELVDYLENVLGDRQYLLNTLHNYRKMLRNIDINLVFLEADLSELSNDIEVSRSIYNDLDLFRRSLRSKIAKNVEISIRRSQFEIRHGKVNESLTILDGLLFKSNLKIPSKVYVLQEYLTILKKTGSKEACTRLLDAAVRDLPFSRLVYNIYCDYLIEFDKHAVLVPRLVKLFESGLLRAKKASDTEFNMMLHLYQSTMRNVCKSIELIFKIEKSLSLRFKDTRQEGEEFELKSRELGAQLETEMIKLLSNEPTSAGGAPQSNGGYQPGGSSVLVGKRGSEENNTGDSGHGDVEATNGGEGLKRLKTD